MDTTDVPSAMHHPQTEPTKSDDPPRTIDEAFERWQNRKKNEAMPGYVLLEFAYERIEASRYSGRAAEVLGQCNLIRVHMHDETRAVFAGIFTDGRHVVDWQNSTVRMKKYPDSKQYEVLIFVNEADLNAALQDIRECVVCKLRVLAADVEAGRSVGWMLMGTTEDGDRWICKDCGMFAHRAVDAIAARTTEEQRGLARVAHGVLRRVLPFVPQRWRPAVGVGLLLTAALGSIPLFL